MDGSAHTDKGEVLESAGIKVGVRADLNIVSDGNVILGLSGAAADMNVVLNDRVLTDGDDGLVSTDHSSVPERGSFTEVNITDDSGIRRDPVGC